MRRHHAAFVMAAGIFATLPVGSDAASFKIVAHPAVPVTSLSRPALSAAFLKRTEKWPDGTPIVPIDQAHDSQVRLAFSRDVHDRSIAMIDAYWQKQVFSGHGTPPLTRASDAEVVAYVRGTPGAIGYVSAGADTNGLREIHVE